MTIMNLTNCELLLYKKLPSDLKTVQIINPYVLIDKNQARITMRIIDTHPSLKRSELLMT